MKLSAKRCWIDMPRDKEKIDDGWGRKKQRFPVLAAYDLCLKCSHLFNILDARGAISVTERVGVIARVRALAVGIAKAHVDQQRCEMSEMEGRGTCRQAVEGKKGTGDSSFVVCCGSTPPSY